MELFGITEAQLAEYFLLVWPDDFTLDQCRERLELYIYEAIGEEAEDDEELRISPMTIHLAMRKHRLNWFDQQPKEKQKRLIEKFRANWKAQRSARREKYLKLLQTQHQPNEL